MTEGDCVTVAEKVAAAVSAADKLKTKNANEANTKALVIEPFSWLWAGTWPTSTRSNGK